MERRCFALLSVLGLFLAPSPSQGGGPFRFTTFELAATPGTTCPGGGSSCANAAAEPAIRADNDGVFYASSENGLGSGTLAWKSVDGGLHYAALASPNATSTSSATGFAPGGGDTDVAVAPVKNASGFYNLYVASLNGANVDVSTSQDGGQSWSLNPTGATVPGDDREWIAADAASKVCIAYHDSASNIDVNCSADAGATFTQVSSAIDAGHAWLVGNNEIGSLAIDPGSHSVYQVLAGLGDPTEVSCITCGFHAVWIGVSTDGGQHFTDYPVTVSSDTSISYAHSFVNVSIDRGGNLYALFSDDHDVFYSFSTNGGQGWSSPAQVNQRPSRTAIFPWSTAGAAGKIDIVWYGTKFFDGVNTPDTYPTSASWYVFIAQNLQATTPGSTFTQQRATRVIHRGGVCESGITCTGNRDLFDDFGVAASPTTGRASIVYSDDRFTHDANDPAQSGCTKQGTNMPSCDHTSVATQVTGPGIF